MTGIEFYPNGDLLIKGYTNTGTNGHWDVKDDIVRFTNIDTLAHIFEAEYSIEYNAFNLNLVSEKTTIHCTKVEPKFSF